MRLFVAIFLPETVLLDVQSLSRRLPSPRLRWVAPASIHITMKFLGETEPSRLPVYETVLAQAAAATPRFRLGVAGGGVFPDARRPRIFWAGLSGDIDRLIALAGRAEAGFSVLGVPEEDRAFAPHLTLARCRADARCLPADADEFLSAAQSLASPSFPVNALHLVQSHLGASGSRYETLRSFPLAA